MSVNSTRNNMPFDGTGWEVAYHTTTIHRLQMCDYDLGDCIDSREVVSVYGRLQISEFHAHRLWAIYAKEQLFMINCFGKYLGNRVIKKLRRHVIRNLNITSPSMVEEFSKIHGAEDYRALHEIIAHLARTNVLNINEIARVVGLLVGGKRSIDECAERIIEVVSPAFSIISLHNTGIDINQMMLCNHASKKGLALLVMAHIYC